jgi:glutamine synthetase
MMHVHVSIRVDDAEKLITLAEDAEGWSDSEKEAVGRVRDAIANLTPAGSGGIDD